MERHESDRGTAYWTFPEAVTRMPQIFGSTLITLLLMDGTGLRGADTLCGEPYDFIAVGDAGTFGEEYVDVFLAPGILAEAFRLLAEHFPVTALSFGDHETPDGDYYAGVPRSEAVYLRVRP